MRNDSSRQCLLAVVTCSLLSTFPALAQQTGQPSAPTPPQTVHSDGTSIVVPSLKGLVFLAGAQGLLASGASSSGVNTSAVPMLDEPFQAEMTGYLGHPLTFDRLNQITRAVVTYYRQHNHPLVDAVVPTQSVEGGVIQIVVTEFRVGEVKVQGNRWFSDRIVAAPVSLQHGDTVDSQLLINQLDAANTNPFRRVNLVYQPAAESGYTNLVLQTQDRLPVQGYFGFSDSGLPVTGRNRLDFGATWGNALWRDQQLSYQFSASTDLFGGRTAAPGQPSGASFVGHFLTWSMPVRSRDSISISGGYQRSVPNVGLDFGLVGVSGQAGIRYNLALRRTGSLIHTLQIGYEFKTTNNNLQFGGDTVSRTNAEINQVPVVYAANLSDKRGSTALTTALYFSPGRITPDNNDDAFRPAAGQSGRPLASARYTYWRSDATRLSKLPLGSVWALRLVGQLSSSNLLYTEQLAGGGGDILRGYDPNQILGDRGLIVSNELRTPSFQSHNERFQVGQLQFLGFWDWGHLNSVHPIEGAVNHLNASSAGMGIRYNLRANLSGKFDYGWQLQHLPGAGNRDHLLNFALTTSF